MAADPPLPVVATFSILGDLVKSVGGDRVAVTTLVGPGGDVHVYSPTPADVRRLADARLIVVNGLKLEGWIDRLVVSSGTKAPVVVATRLVTPIDGVAEVNGKPAKDKPATGNAPPLEPPALDPHAWQSVANTKLYVGTIKDALIAADAANADVYTANADAYLGKLTLLEVEVQAAVARISQKNRRIITSHDAFGYFGKAYGVEFIAPQGVSTEAEASAKDVARIIRQIKAEKIPAVFLENITSPRLIRRIAVETGAKIGGTIYSDALSDEKGPAPTYIEMIRHNIRQFDFVLVN